MEKFIRTFAAVLIASVLVFTLAGCSNFNQAGQNMLRYGTTGYTAINPALYEHGEINLLLFDGLTAHDKDNKIIPALAERWEYDQSTNTYTFYLRSGVTWHDGQAFTAEDVKFTLEAIATPDNLSEIASNYEEITAIEVKDPLCVAITLSAPNVAMLDYLTVGILPRHLLEGKDLAKDPFNQAPVGTGPYRIESWQQGKGITLIKNKEYYRGEPKIERIYFKTVEDTSARALQLRTGELDIAQITPQDAEQFSQSEDFHTYVMSTADYRGILYNFAHPLFRNHRGLSQALSYAIDRQAIVDAILLGYGEAAYSPLQAGPYAKSDINRYDYNPQLCRQLLEANGWITGNDGIYQKDGTRLAFTIHCPQGDQVRLDMALICAQQLRDAGADVTAEVTAQIDWAGQAAYLIGWGSPFDPDDHTYKVFGTGKGSNFSAYSNSKVDSLLTAARETTDEAERLRLYGEFQTALSEDPPYTFLAYLDAIYVASPRVSGIEPDTVLGHHGVGIFHNITEWQLL